MTNGNTGVSDVIIGNHHCRLLWDALQSKEEMIIRKPPDGGEPMRIPIDWRMTRLPQAALTQPHHFAIQEVRRGPPRDAGVQAGHDDPRPVGYGPRRP